MKKIVLLVLLALFIATFAICDEESLSAEQEVLPLAEVEELNAVETLAVKKAKKHIAGKKVHKRHHAGKKVHKRHHAGKKGHKKHMPKKAGKKPAKKPAKKIAKKANRKARRQQKKAARKAKKQQKKSRLQVLEMKVNALMAAEKSLEKAEADLSKLAGQTGAQPNVAGKVSISQAVINTLNTKVVAIENTFNAQIKAANDKIAALTNQVNYANGKITSLEASLNQLRTQANVAPVQADLNNVKNSIASINNNLNSRVANLENINNQKNVGPVSFPRGILVGNRWIINEEGTGTYEALVFRDRIRSQTRDSRYAFFKERYVDL